MSSCSWVTPSSFSFLSASLVKEKQPIGEPVWLQMRAVPGQVAQLLPAGINDLSREISNQLLRIKVRGKVGAVRFEKELVPIVTDPLKRVWTGVWPGGGKK